MNLGNVAQTTLYDKAPSYKINIPDQKPMEKKEMKPKIQKPKFGFKMLMLCFCFHPLLIQHYKHKLQIILKLNH